jgi:hypothetical protein
VRPSAITTCCGDLANIRNKLVHDGIIENNVKAAAQIIERIVRALLRRKTQLPDEFLESQIFVRVGKHSIAKEGLGFGWLGPFGKTEIRTKQTKLRVGDPDNVDGRHVLYAREAGIEIRMLSNFLLS